MQRFPRWYRVWLVAGVVALLLVLAVMAHYAHQRGLPMIDFQVWRRGDLWKSEAYGGLLQMALPWSLLLIMVWPILALPVSFFIWRKPRYTSEKKQGD